MADTVFMDELCWRDYRSKVAAGAPVFLPLGSTEQHRPHMAMNVDVVLPTAVCEPVARKVGGLVAPIIPMATSRCRGPAAASSSPADVQDFRALSPIFGRWTKPLVHNLRHTMGWCHCPTPICARFPDFERCRGREGFHSRALSCGG
jgi:hypothetical protein